MALQMYHTALNAMSSIIGVPYSQMYDIRGNHDTFNSGSRWVFVRHRATWRVLGFSVPLKVLCNGKSLHCRCGAVDYYCRYSARAARTRAQQGNVSVREEAERGGGGNRSLSNATSASDNSGSTGANWGPQGRVFVEPVYGSEADMAAADGRAQGSCPLAIVVGVDASLDPGLRSPTNFLGEPGATSTTSTTALREGL